MNENREILHKELDLIQGCISRMANNTFLIKGFWVTSVLAIFSFGNNIQFNTKAILIVVVTIISWLSDCYYLHLEKLYRKKYEWVVEKRMTTLEYCYDLKPYNTSMHLPNCNIETRYLSVLKSAIFIKYFGLIVLLFFIWA